VLGGTAEQHGIPDRFHGGDQEQPASVRIQRSRSRQEALLDSAGHLLGGPDGEAGRRERRGGDGPELEQGEGIAARLSDQPVAHPRIERRPHDGAQQRLGVAVLQPADEQLGKAGELVRVRQVHGGEDHRHRLGFEPPRDEAEDLGGGGVEPVRVIDDAQQRPGRRGLGHEAENGRSDQQTVRGVTRGEPERHTKRALLGAGSAPRCFTIGAQSWCSAAKGELTSPTRRLTIAGDAEPCRSRAS
jgi:hypothetical protein